MHEKYGDRKVSKDTPENEKTEIAVGNDMAVEHDLPASQMVVFSLPKNVEYDEIKVYSTSTAPVILATDVGNPDMVNVRVDGDMQKVSVINMMGVPVTVRVNARGLGLSVYVSEVPKPTMTVTRYSDLPPEARAVMVDIKKVLKWAAAQPLWSDRDPTIVDAIDTVQEPATKLNKIIVRAARRALQGLKEGRRGE